MQKLAADLALEPTKRDARQAMARGWRGKCPNCGEGAMMQAYLVVAKRCPNCGEELYHHRADDGPAWATILLAGHLVAPLMLFVATYWEPEPWMMALGFSTSFTLLALLLLPRLKGVFVGVQWARRMHGFGRR